MQSEIVRKVLLGLLWIDGFLVGILGLAFLQLSIGSVAFPISALAAGLANYILLWFSATLTAGAARYGAMVAFVMAFFVAAAGGPGGDAVIAQDWRSFLLLGLGIVAPLFVGFAGLLPTPEPAQAGAAEGGRE